MENIFSFLAVGWISVGCILSSWAVEWISGGLHFCLMGCGVDKWWITFLPSGLWGGLVVDYIFAFWAVGWISGVLHFCLLSCGVD